MLAGMSALHHHHDHQHHHPHGHSHGPADYSRAFAIGVGLNLAYVAVEAGFGVATGSLALMADAGHNLSDVLGLLLAWIGAKLAARRPTPSFTYGLGRSSILASLGNALLLLIAVGAIATEAVDRLSEPRPVPGGTVMAVAGLGIVVNFATAMLFARGRRTDVNIRGAYLHMMADAAVSAGVVVSGLLIGLTGWLWLDPAVSLAVALVITIGTWGLLKEAVRLSLDAVPSRIDRSAVETYLAGLPGVAAVHDVHIWPMSTSDVALTAHLVRPGSGLDDSFLMKVADELEDRFGIGHATIQLESAHHSHGCEADGH